MSGGHYNYKYQSVSSMVSDIEEEFANGDLKKYLNDVVTYNDKFTKGENVVTLLAQIDRFKDELKVVAEKMRDLEYFMSGDTTSDDIIESLLYKNNLNTGDLS